MLWKPIKFEEAKSSDVLRVRIREKELPAYLHNGRLHIECLDYDYLPEYITLYRAENVPSIPKYRKVN